MKLAILGTGVVGQTLGSKLVQLGHDVRMGSRKAGGEKAKAWIKAAGSKASEGTFADAAAHGEIVFNCTSGMVSLDALKAAGTNNLDGKVLVDVANPLDFSKGMPPTLSVSNNDSLGEQIQRAFPRAKVVKALNTMNTNVMVDPGKVPGQHTAFVCGNDTQAKGQVIAILQSFGWKDIIDLGDITGARGQEMILPIWLRLFTTLNTPNINFHIAR
jgi:predicted dinucleotide-binding enzyme